MKPRLISNPPNPYHSTEVEYLEGEGAVEVSYYEDHARSIIARNDSPDVGFTWSVNPYRGCRHACAYCLSGDTLILMGDGATRPLSDLRVGDLVYGTRVEGSYRRYVRTEVKAHWRTVKPAYRVTLEDGTELVASGDHRFLTERGWKYVADAQGGQRPHLTTNNRLIGVGALAETPPESEDYRRGYLCGMVRGDGTLRSYSYERPGRAHGDQHHFRLALVDLEALQRTRSYLRQFEVQTHDFLFKAASGERREMQAIRTHARGSVERIRSLVAWPDAPSDAWRRGFLAGIFDAEGSHSLGVLRIANTDDVMIDQTVRCLRHFGFTTATDHTKRQPNPVKYVRFLGGLRERLRFIQLVGPAITRKRDIAGMAVKHRARLRVVSVEPLGLELPLFDITTGTGDFIANGVVSHNCYARPGHEYLGFGAGTDFETKIAAKLTAPALLREAFDKPSWKGEPLFFSGVTDCYQPLEAALKLTRGCLEVCLEYRNPVSIITKAPLIERDLELLARLHAEAGCSVAVSIPFWDKEHARAIEPWVATPERRIEAVRRLAGAGVPVGVMVAPIIPGLNDEDLVRVLTAAAQAGARWAGHTIVRLPGPVAEVFEQRVRTALPERAERILHRIREVRGGKLNNAQFGARMRGEGPYAQTISALFAATCKRLGLNRAEREMVEKTERPSPFRRPPKKGGQLSLF